MTTARDVIAVLKRNGIDVLTAPDSVRLELAALLSPWRPIDTEPSDDRPILLSDGKDVWPGKAHKDGSLKLPSRGACKFWMDRPAPPSEDRT